MMSLIANRLEEKSERDLRLIETICKYLIPEKPLDFLTKEFPKTMTPESFQIHCKNIREEFKIETNEDLLELYKQVKIQNSNE